MKFKIIVTMQTYMIITVMAYDIMPKIYECIAITYFKKQSFTSNIFPAL
jgi:hypothetical protein